MSTKLLVVGVCFALLSLVPSTAVAQAPPGPDAMAQGRMMQMMGMMQQMGGMLKMMSGMMTD